MVSPLLTGGLAAAANAKATFVPNFKIWTLRNLDSNQLLQGQFEASSVSRDMSTNWGQFTSLNRGKPILQFLNGGADKVSFDARLYRKHALDTSPELKLDMLRSWGRIESQLRRPPICQFWIGDGHVTIDCVIVGIGEDFGRPDVFGGLRDVKFTVSLLEYTSYSINDAEQRDTRYARVREREYFESLARDEYGDPMIGDVIRKQHPGMHNLKPGDIVRLPSIEGVRHIEIKQTSVPLKTAFGRKNTPQRKLRLQFIDKRSGRYVSHIR